MLSFSSLCGQENNLKEKALSAFRKGDYKNAIELLEKAKNNDPKDAEIYYYLGYFFHYLAYDSRPLIGYNDNYSDNVLHYLSQAIELNPEFGDAYYFIGAEYGARAIQALQRGDKNKYISSYQIAYAKGAFPAWLIEYAKNTLKSCDEKAILFVGGDAEFNPIQYLQVVEDYRKDVTLIPIGLLNRPWYVQKLRNGFDDILPKAPISLSNEQILDMHPYKWDTLTIEIPISQEIKKQLSLQPNAKMRWKIEPDLKSERRTYLSPERAVLANIIETNHWERPIYFSLGCHIRTLAGLHEYFQLDGFVNKLLPFKTRDTEYVINPDKIEQILLVASNIKNLRDVDSHNMPRVSNILLNYYSVIVKLANYYSKRNQPKKVEEIVDFMKRNMKIKALPKAEKIIESVEDYLGE